MSRVDEATARANARKIQEILTKGEGFADLYRTVTAGPSGQRADLHVGRVWYRPYGPDDFTIVVPGRWETAGYARRDLMRNGDGTYTSVWSITRDLENAGLEWVGYASTLSVGVDACINGVHVATGHHDSRRISPGWVRRPSVYAG